MLIELNPRHSTKFLLEPDALDASRDREEPLDHMNTFFDGQRFLPLGLHESGNVSLVVPGQQMNVV